MHLMTSLISQGGVSDSLSSLGCFFWQLWYSASLLGAGIDTLLSSGCLIGNNGNNATLLGACIDNLSSGCLSGKNATLFVAGIDTLLSSGCLSGNNGNNGTFLGLHVKYPIFFPPDLNQIWFCRQIFTDFPKSRNPSSRTYGRAGGRAESLIQFLSKRAPIVAILCRV